MKQINLLNLFLFFIIVSNSAFANICDRTPQVKDEILEETNNL